MPNLGPQELLIILAIVIVLFGASKLPQLGRGIGEGIRNFKKGLKSGDTEELQEGQQTEESSQTDQNRPDQSRPDQNRPDQKAV